MKKIILFPLLLAFCAVASWAQMDVEKLQAAAKLHVKVSLLYKKTGALLTNAQNPSKQVREVEKHELVCDGIVYNAKGNVAFDKDALSTIEKLEKEHRPVALIIEMVGLNGPNREPITYEAGVGQGINTKLFGNRDGRYLTFPLVARTADFKEELQKIFNKRHSLTREEIMRLLPLKQKCKDIVTKH